MRICLVSHLTKSPDEGVRNIAVHLADSLRAYQKVLFLHVLHPTTWWRIRQFRPEIIHFVLSPTGIGLLVAKAISFAYRRARTVVSAPHPGAGVFSRWLEPFRPNLVLVQSSDSERKFLDLGYSTAFLPNGVDIDRFAPVSDEIKRHLRGKYAFGDQFVLLHVGPLKRGRNIQILGDLQGSNRQVLIVGRSSDPGEKAIVKELRERGCIIWQNYCESIHEIYALSDCYVFPTLERRHCIEMPLSVLEAMACNLPIVTTPFGALPRIAHTGQGLYFAQSAEDFEPAIEKIEANIEVVNTRKKVLRLSWKNVTHQMKGIYEQLLD